MKKRLLAILLALCMLLSVVTATATDAPNAAYETFWSAYTLEGKSIGTATLSCGEYSFDVAVTLPYL